VIDVAKKVTGQDRAFLDAIAANPADDAPRLIYADWLDEQGQTHRAEFIRLQVRLARLDEHDPDRLAPEQRADDLLLDHGDEWRAALPAWAKEEPHLFRRGFLDRISVTVSAFLKRGRGLLAVAPVGELYLRGASGKVASLAASPLLARVWGLDLSGERLSGDDLAALTASPHLGGLTSLALRGDFLQHASALTRWPQTARLRRLDVHSYGNPQEITDAVVKARLDALEWLDLFGHDAGPAQLRALAEGAPSLAHLQLILRPGVARELGRLAALRSLHLFTGDHPAEVPALAESPLLGRLESLQWPGMAVGPELVRAVLSRLGPVRWLNLSGSPRGHPAGVVASVPLPSLVRLSLSQCVADAGEVERLAAAPHLGGLRWLEMGGNSLGDRGAAALAAGRMSLERLELGSCGIGPAGAAALAASPAVAGLRHLSLRNNRLGPEGVRALARSSHLGALHTLHLEYTEAGEEGVRALARSPNLPGLRRLYLSGNVNPEVIPREFADRSRRPGLLVL
jgi:uncharacterized protein (TIGR02996 family)